MSHFLISSIALGSCIVVRNLSSLPPRFGLLLVRRVRASPLRPGAPGLVGTRQMGAMVSVCRQSRRPLLCTHGHYLRLRTRTLGVGPRHGWRLLPECARTSTCASAYCTVPAAVPSARSHSCSLSVSASMVPPMTAERQTLNPLSIVQSTRSLSTRALISSHVARNHCSPAAFRLRNQ